MSIFDQMLVRSFAGLFTIILIGFFGWLAVFAWRRWSEKNDNAKLQKELWNEEMQKKFADIHSVTSGETVDSLLRDIDKESKSKPGSS